jgi:hypothetical protein
MLILFLADLLLQTFSSGTTERMVGVLLLEGGRKICMHRV